MSSWLDRLKAVVGPRGYDKCMRRSVQSIVLYEAKRCLSTPGRLAGLRPFQRKLAFVDQAHALVDRIDFLFPHQKEEILWRTATSKEYVQPDIAWKRVKLIEREMACLAEKVKRFLRDDRSHQDCCNDLVQALYEELNGKGRPHPLFWEHAHNNAVMAFRMYYHYDQLDPNFPEPIPLREIVVPANKPAKGSSGVSSAAGAAGQSGVSPCSYYLQMNTSTPSTRNYNNASAADATDDFVDPVEAMMFGGGGGETVMNNPAEARRRLLDEVKQHLDLLREFQGVVDEETLAQRKRELFAALPPAPPPNNNNNPENAPVPTTVSTTASESTTTGSSSPKKQKTETDSSTTPPPPTEPMVPIATVVL